MARLPATDATLRMEPLVLSGSPVLNWRQFHGQTRCSGRESEIIVQQNHSICLGDPGSLQNHSRYGSQLLLQHLSDLISLVSNMLGSDDRRRA
jgi:hypothetical protein